MASMRSIGVRLRLLVDGYKKDAKEAEAATTHLGQTIDKTGKKGKADLDKLAGAATLVGLALVGAAGVAIVAAAKFDKQMSEVGAVANATAEDLGKLRQAALDAGAATSFSASQAAQAEAELAKAGISTADILGGALTGALSLAAAGSLELATAAEIGAAAMNTFGLGGADMEHIADVLAAAANKSSAGVEDLGQGLQQVGLIAAQVGFGLEETVAILGAFADRGLKGSDGATSLKTALLRLAAPLDEAAELMGELGISMYDANGNLVDSVSIAGQLQTAFKDMAPAQRNAAMQTIFGSDAIRAANVLYEEGAEGIQEYIDAVNDQGAAARVAAQKLDNLAGDVEALTGSLETLFITSGSGASGGLRMLTQAATGLTNAIGTLPGPVLAAGTVLAGTTGIALLTFAAIVKLRAGVATLSVNLIATGAAGRIAGTGLAFMAARAGTLTVALAALSIALMDSQKSIRINEKYAADLGRQFNITGDDIVDTLHKTDAALAKMAQSGRRDEALAAVGEAAKAAGISMEYAQKQLPLLSAALEGADEPANKLGDGLSYAEREAAALLRQLPKLNNELLTFRGAERGAEAAVDDLQEALKVSNGSLDIHDEKGRAAAAAVDDLARAADAAAAAKLAETGSIDEATKVYDNYIAQLRNTLINAGMAAGAVDELIDAITRVPTYKSVVFEITTKTFGAGRQAGNNRWGGVTEHAAAGVLRSAHVASPPTRYAYAEPETGGEAFVPKHGNYGRSMSILSAAAGWYNADVVPRGGDFTSGGGGAQRVDVVVSAKPGTDRGVVSALVESLRFEVRTAGQGSAQTYFGQS